MRRNAEEFRRASGMQQVEGLPMFDPPSVPRATSEDAAGSIKPKRGAQQRLVLDSLIISHDGLTANELARALSLPGDSIRPRLWELEHCGWVARAGDTRQTEYHKAAFVWRITDAGRRAVRDNPLLRAASR